MRVAIAQSPAACPPAMVPRPTTRPDWDRGRGRGLECQRPRPQKGEGKGLGILASLVHLVGRLLPIVPALFHQRPTQNRGHLPRKCGGSITKLCQWQRTSGVAKGAYYEERVEAGHRYFRRLASMCRDRTFWSAYARDRVYAAPGMTSQSRVDVQSVVLCRASDGFNERRASLWPYGQRIVDDGTMARDCAS